MNINLEQLWIQVFGEYEPVARIIIAFAAFALVLYLLARPQKGSYLSVAEQKKQQKFNRAMVAITVIFSVSVWLLAGPR